ncbi:hypothetical protein IC582_026654 [Cucumis melo]
MGRQPIGGRPATTIVRHPSWNDFGYSSCQIIDSRTGRCKTDSCFDIIIRQFRIQKWRNELLYPQLRCHHVRNEFSITKPSGGNMTREVFSIWPVISLENSGDEVVIPSINCRITEYENGGKRSRSFRC